MLLRLLVVCVLVPMACRSHTPEKLPVEDLTRLEFHGKGDLAFLDKTHVVVVHIDQLTCMTCVNINLKKIKRFHEVYGDRIGFVAVVRDYDFEYLSMMKRVGITPYPVLVGNEAFPLPGGFHVGLYETLQLQLLERVIITPSTKHELSDFERLLKKVS